MNKKVKLLLSGLVIVLVGIGVTVVPFQKNIIAAASGVAGQRSMTQDCEGNCDGGEGRCFGKENCTCGTIVENRHAGQGA